MGGVRAGARGEGRDGGMAGVFLVGVRCGRRVGGLRSRRWGWRRGLEWVVRWWMGWERGMEGGVVLGREERARTVAWLLAFQHAVVA